MKRDISTSFNDVLHNPPEAAFDRRFTTCALAMPKPHRKKFFRYFSFMDDYFTLEDGYFENISAQKSKIYFNEVYYLKPGRHITLFYDKQDKEYKVRKCLCEFAGLMEKYGFFTCFGSTLVNEKHLAGLSKGKPKGFKRNILLDNNVIIRCSRRRLCVSKAKLNKSKAEGRNDGNLELVVGNRRLVMPNWYGTVSFCMLIF